jgi:O-antigen/teichoic acid export membrane protein
MVTVGRIGHRVLVGGLDQAASSLSNILIIIALARASSPDVLGAATVGFAAIMFAVGVQRASLGSIISTSMDQLDRAGVRQAIRISSAFGAVSLVLGLVLGWVTGSLAIASQLYGVLIATGCLVLIQDAMRFVAVSIGHPGIALASDLAWLAPIAGVLALGVVAADAAPLVVALAWGAGVVVATALAWVLLARKIPRGAGRGLGLRGMRPLVGDGVLGNLIGILIPVTVALALGAAATAALRGASTSMGPLNVLFSTVPLVLIPELVRAGSGAHGRLMSVASACLVLITAGWAGCLALLPDSVGVALLGETWKSASTIIPVMGLEYLFLAAATPFSAAIKAHRAFGLAFSGRLIYSGAAIAGVVPALILLDSVLAVAAALALAACLNLLVVVLLHRRAAGAATNSPLTVSRSESPR